MELFEAPFFDDDNDSTYDPEFVDDTGDDERVPGPRVELPEG